MTNFEKRRSNIQSAIDLAMASGNTAMFGRACDALDDLIHERVNTERPIESGLPSAEIIPFPVKEVL